MKKENKDKIVFIKGIDQPKTKKSSVDKSEIIITITVIVLALILGIFLGKELFDAFQAKMN